MVDSRHRGCGRRVRLPTSVCGRPGRLPISGCRRRVDSRYRDAVAGRFPISGCRRPGRLPILGCRRRIDSLHQGKVAGPTPEILMPSPAPTPVIGMPSPGVISTLCQIIYLHAVRKVGRYRTPYSMCVFFTSLF